MDPPIWWIIAFVLIFLHIQAALSVRHCDKGQVLYSPRYGSDVCLECFPGGFMPEEGHTHRQCYSCTEIQDPQLEILVSLCNKTHDTEIHCIEGYHRTYPSYPDVRGQCHKCTECSSYTGRHCQKFSDTVCCPEYYYEVYIDRDGKPKCVQQCVSGQMLDPVKGECVTCPHGTYMDEGRHINIHCKECEIVRSVHETILHPCTSTHQTVIGCIEGFYRQRLSNSFSLCVPCQNCSHNTDGNIYEGQGCDQSRDTVCCPRRDMTVVDANNGIQCISEYANSTAATSTTPLHRPLCGEGEYLFTNATTHSATCQPCPQGIYMDETEHTRGVCKSCTEFPHVKFCPSDTTEHKSNDDTVLTVGGVVGLLVGTVVITVLVVLVIVFVRWKRYRKPPLPRDIKETMQLMPTNQTEQHKKILLDIELRQSMEKEKLQSDMEKLQDALYKAEKESHRWKAEKHKKIMLEIEGRQSMEKQKVQSDMKNPQEALDKAEKESQRWKGMPEAHEETQVEAVQDLIRPFEKQTEEKRGEITDCPQAVRTTNSFQSARSPGTPYAEAFIPVKIKDLPQTCNDDHVVDQVELQDDLTALVNIKGNNQLSPTRIPAQKNFTHTLVPHTELHNTKAVDGWKG